MRRPNRQRRFPKRSTTSSTTMRNRTTTDPFQPYEDR